MSTLFLSWLPEKICFGIDPRCHKSLVCWKAEYDLYLCFIANNSLLTCHVMFRQVYENQSLNANVFILYVLGVYLSLIFSVNFSS